MTITPMAQKKPSVIELFGTSHFGVVYIYQDVPAISHNCLE